MIDEKEIIGIPEVQKPISGLGKIFKDTMKEKKNIHTVGKIHKLKIA